MNRHLLSVGRPEPRRRRRPSSTPPPRCTTCSSREVKKLPTLRGRTVVNLFFEDSTRTRISFEIAGKWLSADVINFSAKGSSSVSKGESLRDTVLTVEAMGVDALVIRHPASRRRQQVSQWVDAQRHQRRRRHARAPDPGAARRLHDAQPARRPRRAGTSRSSATCRTAGSPAPTCCCCDTLGAQVTLVAPPTLMPSGIDGLVAADGFATSLRPRRGAARGRRRDDAAGPARADERRRSSRRAREYTVGYGLTRDRLRRCPSPTRSICTPAR